MDDFDVLYSPSMFADYMGQDICTVYMPLYDWESMLNLMPFNALTWKLRGLLAQWAQSGAEFLVMEYNRGQGDDE
ncbi:MAG: hypothetical protein RSD49_08375 [Hafnia sp.]